MPTAVITESSEDDVDDGNLADDAPKELLGRLHPAVSASAGPCWSRADLDEDLVRGLVEQKQAAEQQHQVASADALADHVEQVVGQAHHPAQREQQREAREHRKTQAEASRLVAQLRRQPADQDRDEDDVVDAQDDLQGGQHREGDPDVRVEQEFHGVPKGRSSQPTSRQKRSAGAVDNRGGARAALRPARGGRRGVGTAWPGRPRTWPRPAKGGRAPPGLRHQGRKIGRRLGLGLGRQVAAGMVVHRRVMRCRGRQRLRLCDGRDVDRRPVRHDSGPGQDDRQEESEEARRHGRLRF
jgi:hypothetical protein